MWRHVGRAQLTMRPFSDAFLDGYLAARGRGALRDASAATGSRPAAPSSSRGSRATSSPSWACRCSSCSTSCAAAAWCRNERSRRRRSPACSAGRSGTRARRGCTATGSPATGSRATTSRSRCRPRASPAASRACRRSASAASTSPSRTRRRRWRSPPRRPSAPGEIGAANTLTFGPDGAIHADNTDAYGFIANLRQEAPGWSAAAGPALVLGAGGAARAVVAALIAEGCPEVRVANRTASRAGALARPLRRAGGAGRLAVARGGGGGCR